MQDVPQGGVVVLLKRIQVASEAPVEHHRLLIGDQGTTDRG